VLLCDFHKEQAWNRWIRTSRNGIDPSDKDNVIAMLRNVSHAESVAAFDRALATLKNSTFWKKNVLFRNWLEKKWLPQSKVNSFNMNKAVETIIDC
jgi:hypothetical protein